MPIANFLRKCSIDAWLIPDKVKLDADCQQRIHRPHKQRSKSLLLFAAVVIIGSCQFFRRKHMDTARLFQSGRSQVVCLPKEYRFEGDKVVVRHFGNGVLLLPVNEPWAILDAALNAFEPGFQISRDQPEA
jgi:antitoxin VapB